MRRDANCNCGICEACQQPSPSGMSRRGFLGLVVVGPFVRPIWPARTEIVFVDEYFDLQIPEVRASVVLLEPSSYPLSAFLRELDEHPLEHIRWLEEAERRDGPPAVPTEWLEELYAGE